MARSAYYRWLLDQANDGLSFAWPITVVLLTGVVAGLIRGRPRNANQLGLVLMHFGMVLIPFIVLGVGTLFRCENCSRFPPEHGIRHTMAMYFVMALGLIEFLVAGLLICVSHGWRLLAFFLQAFILWWAFWIQALAGMSISGDWI